MKLLFTFLLLSTVCIGQSKKEQIEGLNKTIDSLNTVLSTTRDNSAKDIGSLNDKIKEVTDEVTALKSDLTNLQSSNNKLSKENEKFKTDLVELSKENEKFKTDLGELSKKNLELEAKLKNIELKTNTINKLIGYWSLPQYCCHKNNTCNDNESAGLYDINFFVIYFDSLKYELHISVYENDFTILSFETNNSLDEFILYYKTSGDYLNGVVNPAVYDLAIGSLYLKVENNKLSFPNSEYTIPNYGLSSSKVLVKCD